MADEPAVTATARCPWCSAVLPSGTVDTCPACGAALVEKSGDQASLPGVTTLDTDAILRARSAVSRPRSRLLSFITGDVEDSTAASASPGSTAPPSQDVRREMLKMALAAEVADLEAEVQARVVEAEVEAREAGLIQPDVAIDLPPIHTAEEVEAAVEELVPAVAGRPDDADEATPAEKPAAG